MLRKIFFVCLILFSFLSLFSFSQNIDLNYIDFALKKIVSLSPHPSGSKNIEKLRGFLITELKKDGLDVTRDEFIPNTPIGKIKMVNVIGEKKGKSKRTIILASHYDSKLFKKFKFIGANDSGSSSAALLQLAKIISKWKDNYFTYKFIFFDGEEAIKRDINDKDGLYGSKHYVNLLKKRGKLKNIEAFILLDMIGDKDLTITPDGYSYPEFVEIFKNCAREHGYPEIISDTMYIVDDHTPFLREGIKSIDIIDFNYGPNNSYWHTKEDNLKHVSANSIYIVCDCTVCMLKKIVEVLK